MATFNPATYGARSLGLDRTVLISERLRKAFDKPEEYYLDRNTALAKLQVEANEMFNKKYIKLQGEKWDDESCRERAEEYTDAVMSANINEFNAEWPESITNVSAQIVARKSKSGQLLVDAGRNGATPKGGRKTKPKTKYLK